MQGFPLCASWRIFCGGSSSPTPVSFVPKFLVNGEVERQGGFAVEKQAQKQLVSQDIVHLYMVEDLGYMLQLPTCLFQRRVVKYDAGVLTLCFDAILSKKALKAKDCIIEQTASPLPDGPSYGNNSSFQFREDDRSPSCIWSVLSRR